MTVDFISRRGSEQHLTRKMSIIEDHDYEDKVRVLSFHSRITWFVENKKHMGINEKWDAFYHICDDFPGYTEKRVMDLINIRIRNSGGSWKNKPDG